MKPLKLVISLFFSTSLFSPVVFADILPKDNVTSVVHNVPFSWTGYYAGLNAGAVNHRLNMTDNQAASFYATLEQVSNPQFTGGFQVGYRHQLDLTKTSGIYGVELGVNFSNAQFKKGYGSPFALYQLNSKNELKNLFLLQLIGGIAADRTLLFLAAGLSWTNITGSTTNLDGVPFFNSFNVNKKILGTAIGGGIEYAFNETISARLKIDVITPNAYTTSDNTGNNYRISNNIVQGTIGLNYKFA